MLAGGELAHDAVHGGEDGAELGLAPGVGQAVLLGGKSCREDGEEDGNVS